MEFAVPPKLSQIQCKLNLQILSQNFHDIVRYSFSVTKWLKTKACHVSSSSRRNPREPQLPRGPSHRPSFKRNPVWWNIIWNVGWKIRACQPSISETYVIAIWESCSWCPHNMAMSKNRIPNGMNTSTTVIVQVLVEYLLEWVQVQGSIKTRDYK